MNNEQLAKGGRAYIYVWVQGSLFIGSTMFYRGGTVRRCRSSTITCHLHPVLFPNTELAKDRIQKILGHGFTGNFTQGFHGLTDVNRDQVGGDAISLSR